MKPLTAAEMATAATTGLTARQAEAACQGGPVLVLAGAGTGKTKTLTAAVVDRITAKGVPSHRVLAVTFTNKAAAEMASRIRRALEAATANGTTAQKALGDPFPEPWVEAPRGFGATTIEQDAGWSHADTVDTPGEDGCESEEDWAASLANFSDPQADTSRSLAAPRWIGTFHGLGARQLRIEPEVAGLRPGFDILDADDSRRITKRVLKALNLNGGDEAAAIGRDPLKEMCNRISKLKDNLVAPGDAPAQIEASIRAARADGTPVDVGGLLATTRVYAAYQRTLRDANAADFGDLLLWPTRAMEHDPAYRARWSGRFDCVLADEYQDVNHAQYTWLKLLSAGHRQIFAVGDDDQSVYSWRGANIEHIRRFGRDFPDAVQFRLEENFRSTGHILAAANAVIAKDASRLGKTLFTRKDPGDRVEVVAFRNAEAEALGIVAEIQRRHADGLGWNEIAVLYRSNALSRGFEEALLRARVPHVLVGDVGFYQRAEIKDALALLRLSATPDDAQADEALRRVVNTPPRGFGAKAMAAVEDEAAWRRVPLLTALETADLPPKTHAAGLALVDAVRGVAPDGKHGKAATLADHLSLLLDATGYRAMLRESRAETTEGRLENLQELIQLAGGYHTARELLDHAALSTAAPGEDNNVPRVRLMTLHKAKGMEFGHVFLPAWESGTFPPDYGDADEERRLAYVAITRGMRRVTISHAGFRRGYAVPSRFIADLPQASHELGWLRLTVPGARLASAHQTRQLMPAHARAGR